MAQTPMQFRSDEERARQREVKRGQAFARERRSQLRGLLLLALAVLVFLLLRAGPLHLFHRDWWRL